MEASKNQVPRHVAIIMDGNRRFAKRLMMKPWKGHEWGAKKFEKILDWCNDYPELKELTLFTFSIQNFNRPKEEFDFLMKIFHNELDRVSKEKKIFDNKIRINFIGRIWMFDQALQDKMKEVMELTKGHDRLVVNLAMAYGGKSEIIDACRKIGEQIKTGKLDIEKINEETFSHYLYIPEDIDLIIRTGGEKRTSNFLMYQSAYAELIFLDKMFPEFDKKDFVECLTEFSERKRRFGK